MTDARTFVSIDGSIADGMGYVPITDRAFLYGDSIFEAFRTYGGRPHALDRHLARLGRSATSLQIVLPLDEQGFRAEIDALLSAADAREGNERRIRLIVTRGDAPGLADDGARRVLLAAPFPGHPDELYERGVSVVCVPGGRSNAATKAGSYLPSILATREAKARGAYEPLLVDGEGRVTEGGTSNVFAVIDGRLHTPDADMLPGVTRGLVLELARALDIAVHEGPLPVSHLSRATEIFITSATREVMPVRELDGRPVAIGPVTRKLAARYRETVPSRLS